MNPSPVILEGSLDESLSRWRWLVKWLLALPHWFLLVFLWIGFVFATFAAFWVVLFTGRYPRGIFDYNVRVLRWTWRVSFYATNALGTDRYPPFHGRVDPDYPAHLDIEYPEHQRRGFALIGWWLLGIPQYAVAAIIGTGFDHNLLGVLVIVAGLLLLFTGRYPRDLFNLVMGCNRYAMRVCAYAALMTPEYPPFRLDQGGLEPPRSTPPAPDRGAASAAA
jgi:Domain of unknown function (DUF4389)